MIQIILYGKFNKQFELIFTKGSKLIQSYLKKTRQIMSVGRMFQTFDKRYFTLDLEKFQFFYSKKLHSDVKSIKQILLEVNFIKN